MYCSHYGFSEKPFDVTPDPKFLYTSPKHRETLAALMYGITERRGFVAIIGEVGTGKTTLLNAALDRLNDNVKVAYIFNTDVTADQLLANILSELGLASAGENLDKNLALERLNRFSTQQLSEGGNVALIVDEAHNLDRQTMESLRLLSNLETHKRKLIQIVLSGQPELDSKLCDTRLRQLAERISLKSYIMPLNEKETYRYIHHRLAVAAYTGEQLLDDRAQWLIWNYSGGIPRRINILCDNVFLIGYGLDKKRITARMVEEAIRDLSWSPFAAARLTDNIQPKVQAPVKQKQADLPAYPANSLWHRAQVLDRARRKGRTAANGSKNTTPPTN